MKYNFWVGPTNCVIDISKNLICHIDLAVIEFTLILPDSDLLIQLILLTDAVMHSG